MLTALQACYAGKRLSDTVASHINDRYILHKHGQGTLVLLREDAVPRDCFLAYVEARLAFLLPDEVGHYSARHRPCSGSIMQGWKYQAGCNRAAARTQRVTGSLPLSRCKTLY